MAEQDVDEDEATPQEAAGVLLDAFEGHDVAALARLDAASLQAQCEARRVLYEYVDALWEEAKRDGLDPALRPEWSAVAGMRDLLMSLQSTAWERVED